MQDSGHMFFNDRWYGFDDAMYTASARKCAPIFWLDVDAATVSAAESLSVMMSLLS